MASDTTHTPPTDVSQYTLMLRIARNELLCVYYHPAIDGSLVSERIVLNSGNDLVHEVEQAVYKQEILLQPFKRIYAILPSPHHLTVPNEVATYSDNSIFFTTLYPDSKEHIVECRMPHTGALMLSGCDSRLAAFLQRTFDRPTLLHPLTPLCEYFYRKSRLGNQCKMYLHLYRGMMDVVCFGRNGLLLANSYPYRHPNDAAYHVLNIWKHLGLDQRKDEIHMAGDIEVRKELSTLLRNYIFTIVPVIFPSHCHVLGGDAMNLSFDLTALSLCEL